MARQHDRDKAETKGQQEQVHTELVSFHDLLYNLRKELAIFGYRLKPDLGGTYCGHSVYHKSNLNISGVDSPDGFFFWSKVEASDPIRYPSLRRLITKICTREMNLALADENKPLANTWREINSCFIDKPTLKNNPVRLATDAIATAPDETVTLSGKAGYYQVVPQVSWFPTNVQGFDARELLSILPNAEAKQLMLILGRLMCGAKNSMTAEGILQHTARSYAIIVGKDPGMGKSTLVGHIKRMIIQLGYTTAEINTDFNRFGWRRIAQSSLATVDDLTEETQKKMIQNGYVKTIVSNDKLAVEDKGVDSTDVMSKTVVIGCSNDSHYGHFIGMDAGALSRLNLLATYNRAELARDNGLKPNDRKAIDNLCLPKYWDDLAQQLDTTADALCCYLLARSAEVFLETCGYVVTDGELVAVKESELYDVTLANRAEFKIRPSLQHMEEAVKATAALCALAIHTNDSPSQRSQMAAALGRTDLCAPLLLGFFELCIADETFEPPLDDLNRKLVATSCVVALRDRIRDIEGAIGGKTSEAAFELAVKELKSVHGFGYPSRSSHYQEYWKESVNNLDTYLELWSQQPPTVTKDLKLAIERVTKYLQRIG